MDNTHKLKPEDLFQEFYKISPEFGLNAINEFKKLSSEDKQAFLEPTEEFVNKGSQGQDRVRSWGITLIGLIGGEDAFRFLVNFLQQGTPPQKHTNRYSRFFALVGLKHLASDEKQRNAELQRLIDTLAHDENEGELAWAGAKLILASQKRYEDTLDLVKILKEGENYYKCRAILRALRELSCPELTNSEELTNSIISAMRDSPYPDIRYLSIQTLGGSDYRENGTVIRALGEIAVTKTPRHLRLEAVMALGRFRNRAAQSDLIYALQDEDAEIRFQAAKALESFLPKKEIVPVLVQLALENEGKESSYWDNLINAMRQIDSHKTLTTEILNKELTSPDRKRAQDAEKILLELGGWAAVQRLSQLKHTLDYLDKLLADSEKVVKSTFEATISQARFNFYFAMGVNILVVLVGLVLTVLAIIQLIQHPDQLEAWVIPGGAGLLGVLIDLVFNNPRKNAREDLATLMEVNVGFYGFLRQLNEIDATFKHAYIENEKFGVPEMQATVQQIDFVVTQALRNLGSIKEKGGEKKEGEKGELKSPQEVVDNNQASQEQRIPSFNA